MNTVTVYLSVPIRGLTKDLYFDAAIEFEDGILNIQQKNVRVYYPASTWTRVVVEGPTKGGWDQLQ